MKIWRQEGDDDNAWTGTNDERWYAMGEPAVGSWPIPEAIAVALMEMGARMLTEAQPGRVTYSMPDMQRALRKVTEQ